MLKHLYTFTLSLLLILPAQFANAEDSAELWDLQMCIDYALENSVQLKQQEINLQLQEAVLSQTYADIFPSINADLNSSLNYGRNVDPTTYEFRTQTITLGSATLSSNLTLFNGFRKWNTIRQNRLNLSSAEADLAQSANDVALNISSAYLQILLSESQARLAQEQLEVISQQVEQTRRMVESGALADNALMEIQAQQARDELNSIVAENNLELAYLNLKILMQADPDKDIRIFRPELDVPDISEIEQRNPQAIYATALQLQPKIQSAAYKIQSAEKGIQVARSGRYPSLNFFAAFRTNYSDGREQFTDFVPTGGIDTLGFLSSDLTPVVRPEIDIISEKIPFGEQLDENFNYAIGLNLTVPIFNGWQVKTNIQRATLEHQSALLGDTQVRNQLRNDIQQAYVSARAAGLRYRSSEANLSAAQNAYRNAEQRFNLGMLNAVDFNTSRNNLQIAETELLNAKFEYIFQLKILDFYEGKPLELN
ncbi:MAG: TolC family protein [Chitinophagaceae bacterium]|nr:MAG: TolC family protein [Chitinophagaceae bacterium]